MKRRLSVKEINACMNKLSPSTRKTMKALRQVILKAAPGMEESIKWGMPCYLRNGLVCSILPAKEHVSLIFYRGTELTDTKDLLEGKGKKIRHVKIREVKDDMRVEIFAAWIREAAKINDASRKC